MPLFEGVESSDSNNAGTALLSCKKCQFVALDVKTISLRSQERNTGVFGKSCKRQIIRTRMENVNAAYGIQNLGSNPVQWVQQIKRKYRHVTAREEGKPALPDRTEPRYSVQRSRPERWSICREEWPDSALLWASNNINWVWVLVCACVCVSDIFLLSFTAPSAGHRWCWYHGTMWNVMVSYATLTYVYLPVLWMFVYIF